MGHFGTALSGRFSFARSGWDGINIGGTLSFRSGLGGRCSFAVDGLGFFFSWDGIYALGRQYLDAWIHTGSCHSDHTLYMMTSTVIGISI